MQRGAAPCSKRKKTGFAGFSLYAGQIIVGGLDLEYPPVFGRRRPDSVTAYPTGLECNITPLSSQVVADPHWREAVLGRFEIIEAWVDDKVALLVDHTPFTHI